MQLEDRRTPPGCRHNNKNASTEADGWTDEDWRHFPPQTEMADGSVWATLIAEVSPTQLTNIQED